MIVGIGLKDHAYTPEAYAYNEYLKSHHIQVQLENENLLCPDNDINIYFMGIRPFWNKYKSTAKEIHEYQSLSTGRAPYLKNKIKAFANKRPAGRIFLNEIVQQGMNFQDSAPYIYRDMGVDDGFFQQPHNKNPEYDIVYSGSITGRTGLIEELQRLALLGFKILIIGNAPQETTELFHIFKNVIFTGRVERKELPKLYNQCRAGLNFTPDIYPFNVQTSTKTLEYIAAGLTLISNQYHWIEEFSSAENIQYTPCHEILKYTDLSSQDNTKLSLLNHYSWQNILTNCNYLPFLKSIID